MDITDDASVNAEVMDADQASQKSQDSAEGREILQRLRQRLAKDPRNVFLLNEVGLAAEQVGDKDRARWAYKRAIRLDPDYEQPYRNLGLLYRNEGHEELAAQALQKYSQLAGGDAESLLAQERPSQPGAQAEVDIGPGLEEPPIFTRLSRVWDEMGLTPAEAMMLLDPDNSSGLQMMQYSLIDLVARGVLEMDTRQRIGRGTEYGRTDLAPHEALFAKYFSRINDYVDINKLARAPLAELNDDDDAYKGVYVRGSLLQKRYMSWRRSGSLASCRSSTPSSARKVSWLGTVCSVY